MIKHLPNSAFEDPEIAAIVESCDFNVNIVRHILLKNRFYKEDNKVKSTDFLFKGDPTSGIICNKLHTPNIIASSSFSENYLPYNILKNDDSYYCSSDKDKYNAYIDIDFSPKVLKLKSYTMRSWKHASNGVAPVTWSLFALVDEKWVLIDKRENVRDLTSDSATVVYDIDDAPNASTYRLEQTANGNPGNKRFALSFFEVFGIIL